MSCNNCSHKLVCKYKPVSPCPIYPDDAALEECGTQPTAHNKPSAPCRECEDFATIGARSFCIRKDKSVPCK